MKKINPLPPQRTEKPKLCKWQLRTILILISLVASHSSEAQVSTVTGRITDEAGEPLAGVNVVVKGKTVGTATDANGRYTLQIEPGTDVVLVVSHLSFDTWEGALNQRSVVDISLTPKLLELEEVVVTGYQSIPKSAVAGAVSTVNTEEMTKISASNIGEMIAGRIPGVQVSTSGDPGSLQYVRIRGIGSLNNNEPLYVIDGVPVQNETNLNSINPRDIETMQVLKDAAAASIYGSRAANGVIVITTRKGSGAPKVSVDVFTGIQFPKLYTGMASPSELLEIDKGLKIGGGDTLLNTMNTLYVKQGSEWVLPGYIVKNIGYAAGAPQADSANYVLNTTNPQLFFANNPIAEAASVTGTNWFEEIFRPAPMTSVQLSSSSGTEKGSQYLSFSYFKQNGVLISNSFERLQARVNTSLTRSRFRIGENINFTYQKTKGWDDPWQFNNIKNAYSYMPFVPLYDIKGYWAAGGKQGVPLQNPVAEQMRWSDGYDAYDARVMGNAFAEVDILKSFTLRANGGLDFRFRPSETYVAGCPECASSQPNRFTKNWTTDVSWVLSTTLNFNKNFEDHSISVLGGWEARGYSGERVFAQGQGLIFGADPNYRQLQNTQPDTRAMSSDTRENTSLSLFGNAGWTFRSRYILAASVRTDGSSRFINDKYGVFPSASVAWRLSSEPFFNTQHVNELKLRTSYGLLGNNEVIGGDYPGHSTYAPSNHLASYPVGGSTNQISQGFFKNRGGNPDLTWEATENFNVGLDALLFQRLSFNADWYWRKTEGMIIFNPQPRETGNALFLNENVGAMLNRGIEFALSYEGTSDQLAYQVGLTGTYYDNVVLSLGKIPFLDGFTRNSAQSATRTEPGLPISQFYGYKSGGIWKSWQEIASILPNDTLAKPGRMRFADLDGDGKITAADKTYLGSPLPKFILGLNLGATYRNFEMSAYLSGNFGQSIFNAVRTFTDFNVTDFDLSTPGNRSSRMLSEAWSPENIEGKLPALDQGDTYSGKISSHFIEKGSFLRCRNLSLGYNVPQHLVSRLRLLKAKVYLQAQNLFTITNYSSINPDISAPYMRGQVQRDMTLGVDLGSYPISRQFIGGFTIEF